MSFQLVPIYRWSWMTLNGVMAVTLRYSTKFGKHAFQHITASICGGIYARVYCFHVRYLICWWVSCCYYYYIQKTPTLVPSFESTVRRCVSCIYLHTRLHSSTALWLVTFAYWRSPHVWLPGIAGWSAPVALMSTDSCVLGSEALHTTSTAAAATTAVMSPFRKWTCSLLINASPGTFLR